MTLAEAQAHLDKWLAASDALASGRDVMDGQQRVMRESATEVRKQINYWQQVVNRIKAAQSGNNVAFGASLVSFPRSR